MTPHLAGSRHIQPVLEQPPQQLPAPYVQLLLQVSVLQPCRLLRRQPVLQLGGSTPWTPQTHHRGHAHTLASGSFFFVPEARHFRGQ